MLKGALHHRWREHHATSKLLPRSCSTVPGCAWPWLDEAGHANAGALCPSLLPPEQARVQLTTQAVLPRDRVTALQSSHHATLCPRCNQVTTQPCAHGVVRSAGTRARPARCTSRTVGVRARSCTCAARVHACSCAVPCVSAGVCSCAVPYVLVGAVSFAQLCPADTGCARVSVCVRACVRVLVLTLARMPHV